MSDASSRRSMDCASTRSLATPRSSLNLELNSMRSTLQSLRSATPARTETPLPAPRPRQVEQPDWMRHPMGLYDPFVDSARPVSQSSEAVGSISSGTRCSTPYSLSFSGRTSSTPLHSSTGGADKNSETPIPQLHNPYASTVETVDESVVGSHPNAAFFDRVSAFDPLES
jgi:hypothetical protein